MDLLDRLDMLVNMAFAAWFYVIVPILVLVGAWIYLKRSPHVNFGIARDLEKEGKFEQAIKYYERTVAYASDKYQERAAQERIGELTRKLREALSDGGDREWQ